MKDCAKWLFAAYMRTAQERVAIEPRVLGLPDLLERPPDVGREIVPALARLRLGMHAHAGRQQVDVMKLVPLRGPQVEVIVHRIVQ